jgi:Acetoacetate decarboxylase (ADC)
VTEPPATYAVTEAAGLPETQLPGSLLARLPATAAGAPWHTGCRIVTWLHTVGPEALEAFPDVIRPERVALVAWALVRYDETPVGPYSELAATLIPDGGDGYGHIPFIVVDSLPSIVGGRVNWLLPKALARFDWSDGGRTVTASSDQPASPAWSITVSFETSQSAAPVTIPNLVQQVTIDGVVRRFSGELSGSMRAGSVNVDGSADGALAALIATGRHDATGLRDCAFDVGPLDPT